MKALILACAIGTSAICLPVHAQWYAGAGLGVAGSALDGSSGNIGLTARDKRNTAVKVYVGYQFTPNWGVEAQLADLGRFGYNACTGAVCGSGSVGVRQWSVAATGTHAFANQYFVFGKLGVTWNQARGDAVCAGAVCGGSLGGTRSDLLVGVGVGYQFTRDVSMRLEYEHFGKGVAGNGFSAKTDSWMASLRYSF
jgi:OOP family OmpA-OmpF porin